MSFAWLPDEVAASVYVAQFVVEPDRRKVVAKISRPVKMRLYHHPAGCAGETPSTRQHKHHGRTIMKRQTV